MTDKPEQKLKACKASGKSMKAFAVSEGLSIQDLYSWKKTLVKKGVLPRSRAPHFQQAQIIEVATGYECRILLPNGITVMFSGGTHDMNLANILHSAMQL